ncbi:MraY family glycosyltransferase [Lentisphaera profundi]|uniref:MraY family glycosyltransferase n=1 Tax=Lentisphaera profundi TaxID=1658616 RepID=A0ABY7VNF7_9BACT|nr:MraY family glycosyltransferase [Lentisphaera profundi]WDE95432.1 MraY family glycosyltransferase [Lentisphaera profundi]
MKDWWTIYLAAMALSFILALVFTAICRKLAWKLNILDKPLSEGHKMHSDATPLLGGTAVCLAWLSTLLVGLFVARNKLDLLPSSYSDIFSRGNPALNQFFVIAFCAVSFVIVGLIDDRKPMSAKFKLFLQALLCFGTAFAGLRVSFIPEPFSASLVTGFILLTILNAVNFLDNMDGLCCGVGAICAGAFALSAGLQEQYLVSILATVTCGSCLGFYLFNCNPASIFLGDSGSHFVGYMLGVCGVLVTYTSGEVHQSGYPFIIPLLILAIPIFDLASVIVIRTRQGMPVYIGDHNHISHRFVKMGFSRRSSVLLVHALCLIICLSGIALIKANIAVMVLILSQVIALLIFMTILHSRQKFRK